MNETYDANVRVRNFPRSADTVLNMLAARRGQLKWEIVRDALIEYAELHECEITERAS